MDTAPNDATERGSEATHDVWGVPTTDGPAVDAPQASDTSADGRAGRTLSQRPASVNAIFGILVVTGGGLLGYAVAIAAGSGSSRDYSLIWALLGAALIVTAWGLRGRHWWAAAATIAVALVGMVAGMLGVQGLLVIANSQGDGQANWITTVGLTAVGAASIAILGLLSSAWGWLTASTRSLTAPAGPGLEAPPAA
jgi:hypothetical protein